MFLRIGKKVIIYCIGLLFLAFGVTFSIKSNLGVSPVNSMPYVISVILEREQGEIVMLVFWSFIVMQIALLGKKFKMKNLLQIGFASLFGYFVNFSNAIVTFPTTNHYIGQLGLLAVSITFISIGIILNLSSDMIPMPPEGVMLAIEERTGMPFHKIKMGFDSAGVIIALILSLIFFGRIIGVREGTIIAALLVGKFIQVFYKLFPKQISGLKHFLK